MIKDKEFWNDFWKTFTIVTLFFILGNGLVWLIAGFIEMVILCFGWHYLIGWGIAFVLISLTAFFITRSIYRDRKRAEYEKRLLSLTVKRDEQRAIFFDENSSDEDKDFAWANVEMYEKEISRIATLYHKYGG
jgi:hypothetical protein